MEIKEAIEIMKTEAKCVKRNYVENNCDRDCSNCELLIDPSQISNAYTVVISAAEKQTPKEPIMKPYDDLEDEYLCCPTCGEILTDRIPFEPKTFYFHCLNCGQKFKWGD